MCHLPCIGSVLSRSDEACPLSCPALAYCFPVVRAALQDRDADSELVVAGLEILGEHAALRGEEGAEENPDLFHPMYLPRAGMVSLTLHLVATTQGTVQQTAVKCLIDTAGAAGGEQGAARAGQQELESLLAAIQVLIDS